MGIGRSHCRARLVSSCWRAAMSAPIASAVRSTALVVTARPASSFICWRPWSNGASEPTTDNMRRTPGDRSRCSTSSWASRGNCPR